MSTRPGRVIPLSDEERQAQTAAADENKVVSIRKPTKAQLRKIGKDRAENIRHLLESMTEQFTVIAIQLAEVKADEPEWKSMGYETFAEYLDGEYRDHLTKLTTAARKAIVASAPIKQAHLTQPELAAITGASERTIRRDQARPRSTGQVSANQTGSVGKDGMVVLEDPGNPAFLAPDVSASNPAWDAMDAAERAERNELNALVQAAGFAGGWVAPDDWYAVYVPAYLACDAGGLREWLASPAPKQILDLIHQSARDHISLTAPGAAEGKSQKSSHTSTTRNNTTRGKK